MKLFLTRHGETDCNRMLIVQGWVHTPLNATGRKQAKTLRDRFESEGMRFDALYSSDLLRAYTTAKILNEYFKLEIKTDWRLREVKRGIWNLQYIPEIKEKYTELWKQWDRDPYNTRPPLGESLRDAEKRIKDFVEHLKNNEESNSEILVVTHRLLIVSFMRVFDGVEVTRDNFFDLMLGNAEYHVIEI